MNQDPRNQVTPGRSHPRSSNRREGRANVYSHAGIMMSNAAPGDGRTR